MTQLTVPSKQVVWLTKQAFASKKRQTIINVTEKVTFHNTFWDGGSKSTYKAVKLVSGETASLLTGASPWSAVAEGRTVELEPGIAIVEESYFQGKLSKLNVYIHPSNAAPLLAAKNS